MNKLFNNEELLKISNNTTFQKYYNQFTLLALNMFEWENLPDGIETRHIEKPLIEFGCSFFYNDDDYGFVCLPCTITGSNIYSRHHYNFLKCSVCQLISDNIPREHLEEIKLIFESGITLWHLENGVTPLDYSVPNHSI